MKNLTFSREVVLSKFVLLDLESVMKKRLSLFTSDCHMNCDLFISFD
jgi:hypothetical protein